MLVSKRVHGLPEAVMRKNLKLAVGSQLDHR
ncbi:MAG: hypothetical protein RJB38_419, partial [Pseudomonadota bacterium]